MAPPEVLVLQEPINVTRNLGGVGVPGGLPLDAEALVEERGVQALDATFGAGGAHLRRALGGALHDQEQLVGTDLRGRRAHDHRP